jgi:hypothetical protein
VGSGGAPEMGAGRTVVKGAALGAPTRARTRATCRVAAAGSTTRPCWRRSRRRYSVAACSSPSPSRPGLTLRRDIGRLTSSGAGWRTWSAAPAGPVFPVCSRSAGLIRRPPGFASPPVRLFRGLAHLHRETLPSSKGRSMVVPDRDGRRRSHPASAASGQPRGFPQTSCRISFALLAGRLIDDPEARRLGRGLAIRPPLATLMGSSIRVESAEGIGRLPAASLLLHFHLRGFTPPSLLH